MTTETDKEEQDIQTVPYKLTIQGREVGTLQLTEDDVRFFYTVLSQGTLNICNKEFRGYKLTLGTDGLTMHPQPVH